MFGWLFVFGLLGAILFLLNIKKWKTKHYAYFISYCLFSLVLIFYYGSWDFHDNPNPNSFTIGNSYTRYWLPIYLGAIPLASIFIIKICNIKKWKYSKIILQSIAVLLIISWSIYFVIKGSEEGLLASSQKQRASFSEWQNVISQTEKNSIIITRYHDKLLFPERKVIVGLFDDDNMLKQYANLTTLMPVYYYNFTLPEKDLVWLNQRRLAKFNLTIKSKKQINNFSLYRLFYNK
jgi:hypothetical protein